MTIRWIGTNKEDCIENFNKWFDGADPNARYYQNKDGKWVIEAEAVKSSIPAVQVRDAEGKSVIMTTDEYDKIKPAKIAIAEIAEEVLPQ
jgi:hypothetical protein